jgi:SOS response associated peptidase (SRAP)
MCGRYGRNSDKQRIAETFHVKSDLSGLSLPPADYNVAPSTFQPVIRESREDGSREMVLMRWGLIPFFTKDVSSIKGISTINARAETVPTAPTWREPLETPMHHPGQLFLRVEEAQLEDKTAVRFQSCEHLDVCVCRSLGRLEGWRRSLASVLQHRDHFRERAGGSSPYSYARYLAPKRLRPMAIPRGH